MRTINPLKTGDTMLKKIIVAVAATLVGTFVTRAIVNHFQTA